MALAIMALADLDLDALDWKEGHDKPTPAEPFRLRVGSIVYGMGERSGTGSVVWGARLVGDLRGAFAVELPSGFTYDEIARDAETGAIVATNAAGTEFRLEGGPAEGDPGDVNVALLLRSKPADGTISAPMRARNLVFFRQRYLQGGPSPFEGWEPGENPATAGPRSSRPPEYCESYAVYHVPTRRKVMHIARARCWDGNGVEGLVPHPQFPGVLIPAVRLVITGGDTPQWGYQFDPTWLASAPLPIRVDPTMGYTSVGASTTPNGDRVLGNPNQEGASGQTYDRMFIYLGNHTGSVTNVGGAVYATTGAAALPGALLSEALHEIAVANSWNELTLSPPLTTSPGAWYGVVYEGERRGNSAQRVTAVWDAGTGAFYNIDNATDYALTDAWPNPWIDGGPTTSSVRIYSLYLESSAAPPAAEFAAAPAASGQVAAALSTAIRIAATVTVSASAIAALSTGIPLATSPAAGGTVSASLSSALRLASSPNAAGTVAAALTAQTTHDLAASPSSSGSLAAALASSIRLAASPSASGQVTSALQTAIRLSAAPSGAGTLAAALSTAVRLAASPGGFTSSGAVSAALSSAVRLAATLSAQATLAAELPGGAPLLATAPSASATVGAALLTSVRLAASPSVSGAIAAALRAPAGFGAALQGAGSLTVALQIGVRFAAALGASGTLAADLAVGPPPPPPVPLASVVVRHDAREVWIRSNAREVWVRADARRIIVREESMQHGNTVRVSATFYDWADELADPETITLTVTDQEGGAVEAPAPVRESLGVWRSDVLAPEGATALLYEFVGTGAALGGGQVRRAGRIPIERG